MLLRSFVLCFLLTLLGHLLQALHHQMLHRPPALQQTLLQPSREALEIRLHPLYQEQRLDLPLVLQVLQFLVRLSSPDIE